MHAPSTWSARLVESSLVVAESRQDVTRYRLLETIREYAAERLDESGSAERRPPCARRVLPRSSRIARALTSLGSRGTSRGPITSFSTTSETTCTPRSNGPWTRRASWRSRSRSPCDRTGSFGATGCRASRGSRRRSRFPCKRTPRVRTDARRGGRAVRAAHRRLRASRGLRRRGDRPRTPDRRARRRLDRAQRPDDDRRNSRRLRACPDALRGVGRREPESRRHRGEGIAYFILAEAAVNCGRYPEAHEAGGRALELGRRFEDPEVMALALARLGLAAASEGRLVEARERLLEALECVQLLGFTEVGAYCCEALALVAAGWGEASRSDTPPGSGRRIQAGERRNPPAGGGGGTDCVARRNRPDAAERRDRGGTRARPRSDTRRGHRGSPSLVGADP